MKTFRLCVCLLAAAMVCHPAIGSDDTKRASFSCKPPAQIKFARDAHSARFSGFIERFRQNCFTFAAKKGQYVNINVLDLNKNVGFTVYNPGYTIKYGNYTKFGQYTDGWGGGRIPLNTYIGQTLTLPPEKQEDAIQKFSGQLPETGTYLIVVDLSSAGAAGWGGTISIK